MSAVARKHPVRKIAQIRSASASTNVDKAFRYIRRLILDGSLKPGMSIGDTNVSEQLSISRTPVREALRRLELEGLVVHVPHRGWAVQALQVEDIGEIFEIKEYLEPMMVRQAAVNLTADAKAKLISAASRMEEAAKNEDREAFVVADDTFHNILYEAASNRRARKILSSINAQWRWVRVGYIGLMGTMSQAIPEHRAILECLLAGDHDGAVSATVRNIFRVKQYLLSILNNLAMPFAETMERRYTTDSPQGVRVR